MARRQHTVSLKVAERCDLECVLCNLGSDGLSSTDKICNQIRGLAGQEPGDLRMFGCDPLVRDDVSTLIQHAKEQGFKKVSIVTNGLRLAQEGKARELQDAGLNEVALTLYSTDPRVHDAITRRQGSHEKLMSALDQLAETELDVRIQIPLLNPRAQNLQQLLDEVYMRLERIVAIELSIPRRMPEGKLGQRLAPPPLSVLRPMLQQILEEAADQGVPCVFLPRSGVPFCALPEDFQTPEVAPYHPTRPVKRDDDSVLVEACADCAMAEHCTGLQAWYKAAYDDKGIQPFSTKIGAESQTSTLGRHFDDERSKARAANVMLKVIRPTIVCNQLCPFCSANETSENSFPTVKKTKKKIIRWYRLGARHLSFSGGEPTLVKELPDYIRLAKQVGYKKIEIVSNGTKTSIFKHAKKLVDAGLDVAFMSLHAATEELSAQCTGCEGDHEKTVRSLHNFQQLGVKCEINHVISELNYRELPNFVTWFHDRFGSDVHVSFAFVSPLYRAKENMYLVPKYADVMPYLKKAMDLLRGWEHPFVVLARAGIPWCHLRGGYMQYSDLTQIANEAHSEDDYKKTKGPICDDCAINDLCLGVFKEYEELHGMDDFKALSPEEVEVSIKKPVNPWYGLKPNQIEHLVRWEHERVDWIGIQELWENAREAWTRGEKEEARRLATEALGFEEPLPPAEAFGDEIKPPRDVSVAIEEAIRAQKLERMEEISYREGLKPVLYLTGDDALVGRLEKRYGEHHIEVVCAAPGQSLGHGVATSHNHIFISQEPEKAVAMGEVYRSGDPTAQAYPLGELMGYPACCSAAFAAMADRSNDSEIVYSVADRDCKAPHPLLNLGSANIVPFYPCRFDCKEAVAWAEKTLEGLFPDKGQQEKRVWVKEQMARPTLYFDKLRALVFDGSIVGSEVRFESFDIISKTRDPEIEVQLMASVLGPYLSGARKIEVTPSEWRVLGPRTKFVLKRRERAPGILLPFSPGAELESQPTG